MSGAAAVDAAQVHRWGSATPSRGCRNPATGRSCRSRRRKATTLRCCGSTAMRSGYVISSASSTATSQRGCKRGGDVIAFSRGEGFVCVVNFGADSAELPEGSVLLSSVALEDGKAAHRRCGVDQARLTPQPPSVCDSSECFQLPGVFANTPSVRKHSELSSGLTINPTDRGPRRATAGSSAAMTRRRRVRRCRGSGDRSPPGRRRG